MNRTLFGLAVLAVLVVGLAGVAITINSTGTATAQQMDAEGVDSTSAAVVSGECDPRQGETPETDSLEAAVDEYCERLETLQDSLDEIGNITEGVESTNQLQPDNATDELEQLEKNYEQFQQSSAEIEQILHSQLMNFRQPAQTRQGINKTMAQLATDREQVEQNVTETTDEYTAALDGVERDAESTVRQTVLLGGFGGLLVGVLVGAIVPWRKGSEASDFYQVSSKTEYTVGVLKLPWVVGLVALVVGTILFLAGDIPGVIV